MSLNLAKGQNLNLSKEGVNLAKIQVGLGWDINTDSTVKTEFDLDVFGLVVDNQNKGVTENDVYFYNNVDGKGTTSKVAYPDGVDVQAKIDEILKTAPIAVSKDNLSGEGSGDDETMFANAANLPKDKKVIVVVNIYEAATRKQTFGMVSNVYCRVLSNGDEVCKYDLTEDFSIESGVIIAEFYWVGDELKVKALGKGFTGDVNDLFNQYK